MRGVLKLVAAVAAATTLVASGVSPALADEASPSPSPSVPAESGGVMPLASPSGPLQASVGQSLQIRMDADAQANSQFGELKWLATQVTAQGTGSGDVVVPMDDTLFRSLDGFAKPANDGSAATFTFTDVNGVDVGRTIALYPMDAPTALSVTTKFTLDGEVVQANDLVGKSGVVTAEYTVTNNTTKTMPATFKSVSGEEITQDVQADEPFVVQATTTLPQRFTSLNTGMGQVGADGLGGNQIMWIGLPFRPLSKDGTATFGWAANVVDGEIPPMVIQAAPVYMPPGEDAAAQASGLGLSLPGGGLNISKPKLGGGGTARQDIGTALSGAKELIGGLKASGGVIGTALQDTVAGVKAGGTDVVAALEQICSPALLNCATFEAGGLNAAVTDAIARVEQSQQALRAQATELEENGAGNQQLVQDLEEALFVLETDSAALQAAINTANTGLKSASSALTTAQTALTGANALLNSALGACESPTNPTPGELGGQPCSAYQNEIRQTASAIQTISNAESKVSAGLTALEPYAGIAGPFAKIAALIRVILPLLPGVIGDAEAAVLRDVANKLTGPLDQLYSVQALMASLAPPLAELKAGMAEIQAAIDGGLKELANLRNTIPAIVSGGGMLKGGMGALSADASGFLGEVVTLALTAKDKLVTVKADAAAAVGEVKTELTELGTKADNVKASIVGLEMAAAQSPLPYSMVEPPTGPITVSQADAANSTPESTGGMVPVTTAFGAYQFMLDPANENTVNTSGRIVTGVILLLLAAGAGILIARRRRA